MSIFGAGPRTDTTPSRHTETTYTFLRRVAGPVWDQCRDLIDDWLATYPESDRASIVGRLRSGNDEQFTSAFWELYLHEMYRCAGWRIQVEPDVPGATTSPDFLMTKDGVSYYVEARCTFERRDDQGAGARLRDISTAVDQINSGPFHVGVTAVQLGGQAPSTRRLRNDLERWLHGLHPDTVGLSLSDDDPNRFEWRCDDWHLVFHPIPRSVEARSRPAQRPLGAFLPAEASVIDDIGTLRAALDDKVNKYGDLPHPLVIAINIGSGFHDECDTEQVLYGTVGWQIDLSNEDVEAVPVLTNEGFWGWPGKPARQHVAGVLLAEGVHYGRVAQYAPAYWPHPNAHVGVAPLETWRVAEPGAEARTYSDPAVPGHTHFGLPEGWPIGERFPRS